MIASTTTAFDELVSKYKSERKNHIKTNWLTFSCVFGRIINSEFIYNKLRNSDVAFLEISHSSIKETLDKHILTNNEIEKIITILKNHRSILSERDSYLIFYIAILAIILIIPREDIRTWVTAIIITIFSLGASIERWSMKQHDLMYGELVELLQYELKQRT